MTPFDLNDFLPYRLTRAAARVSRAFAERYRTEFGISIPEWRVLVHLYQAGGVSVRDIEARTDMEKSKVSRTAARLEQVGYVTKSLDGEDRRLVNLSLTPQGQALVQRILPVALQFQADMRAQLGDLAPALDAALDALSPRS